MGPSFAIYDAFSAVRFGGSQAAVVTGAGDLSREDRVRIAQQFGLPATGFVDAVHGQVVDVQFFSTVAELPMCGHGTLCVITHLLEQGLLEPGNCTLRLPAGSADVAIEIELGRARVMLGIVPAGLQDSRIDMQQLLRCLGVDASLVRTDMPIQVANGDFVHLVVPMRDLSAMHAVKPDFGPLTALCRTEGIQTVALFCKETLDPAATIHVRDFCPAVGVAESAAAGTTNAALAAYLTMHGLLPQGPFAYHAEQGIELGRPSRIYVTGLAAANGLQALSVGGVATRFCQGNLA